MDLFLMTVPIILAIVCVIFYVAKICGFEIELKALFLCIILAFLVNFSSIYLTLKLAQSRYLILGVLLLLATSIVTLYNERLLAKKKLSKSATFSFSLKKKIPTPLPTQREEVILKSTLAAKPTPTKKDTPSKEEKKAALPPKAPHDLLEKVKEQKPLATKYKAKTASLESPSPLPLLLAEKKEKKKAPQKPRREKKTPLSEEKISSIALELPQVKDAPQATKHAQITPKEEKLSVEPKIRVLSQAHTRAKVKSSVRIPPMPDLKNSLEAKMAKLKNLDDFLNLAYEENLVGNCKNSILISKEALKRYIEDDYAPFIIIDIGNTHKVQGEYEEAIKTYQEALKIPALQAKKDILKTFRENIDYLRSIQKVLAYHATKNLPFDKIPKTYRDEIEREYSKRVKTKKGSKP